MEVVATAKSVRITARKARVVSDSVIGLPVIEALKLLEFTPRHGAREVHKVINSAAANAEHNYNLDRSSLRISRIVVEQAGIMKRFIAKPRGMAGSLFKRMSHLRCYVTDDEPAPGTRRRSLVAMPRATASAPSRPAPRRRPARPARPAAEPAAEAAQDQAVAQKPVSRRRGGARGSAEPGVEPVEAAPDEAGEPEVASESAEPANQATEVAADAEIGAAGHTDKPSKDARTAGAEDEEQ